MELHVHVIHTYVYMQYTYIWTLHTYTHTNMYIVLKEIEAKGMKKKEKKLCKQKVWYNYNEWT